MLEEQVASLRISESINVDEDRQMFERIVTPRKGPFSTEECTYFSERFPCTELSRSLLAYRGSCTLPPIFYRGWIINDDDFLARSIDKGLAVFFEDDEDDAPNEPDDYKSIDRYVRSVLKEEGIKPPVKTYVNLVLGPEDHRGPVRLHLSVQDNYQAVGMLSEEEVVRRTAMVYLGDGHALGVQTVLG